MAKILYAGHTIPLPDSVDVEQLAVFLQDSYAKGAHSWVTFELPGEQPKQMRLLFGRGIPVGFVTDGLEEPGDQESVESVIELATGGLVSAEQGSPVRVEGVQSQ